MWIGRRICIIPTPEQEVLFWKSAGVARWAYNYYYLSENERVYKEYLENGKTGTRILRDGEIRKAITVLKKTTCPWLADVSCNVTKQAVKNADAALQKYFKGIRGKPKFKTKHKSKPSFYVNFEHLYRRNGGFQGERLGFVRTSEPLPKLKNGKKYSNPYISYDGKYWYLSFEYEVPEKKSKLSEESLGIDLGINKLAVCSNGKVYDNINRSKEVKRLEKVLKREQRKFARMIETNISGYEIRNNKRYPIYIRPFEECKNFQKQKKKIRLLYRKISNIRNNYLHQVTTEIVKTKPSRIFMETLKVSGMIKK